MTMLDLIQQTRTYTDEIDRLAVALIRTGPVVTDKVTYIGSTHPDGYLQVTQAMKVLPGFPHAKDVQVPADL